MSDGRFRVRLLRWSESSSGGRTVTFQLPDDGDEHPFKGLATGKRGGELLEIAVRPAADPDSPLETLKPPSSRPAAAPGPAPRPKTVRRPATAAGAGADAADAAVASPVGEPGGAGNAGETGSAWRSIVGGLPAAPGPSADGPVGATRGTLAVGAGDDGAAIADAQDDPRLAMRAMAQAALDMRRAAVEIAQDRGGDDGSGDEDDGRGGVVARATALCQEVDHQRAGFFYYMKTRYPSVPELPPEAGQWSRDSNATRHRVCFHCRTRALAELGLDIQAERRFEDLETDYERSERSR